MSEHVSMILSACDEVSTTITDTEGPPRVSTQSPSGDEDAPSDLEVSQISENAENSHIMSCDNEENANSSTRNLSLKNVSFPNEDSELVTGYLDPADPWEYAYGATVDDLISSYKEACQKHDTEPLEMVISQLEKMDLLTDRVEELSLKNVELDRNKCEALEAVLRRVQFVTIDLEAASLDDECADALFEMIEYYESAKHLNISSNRNIGEYGWQVCAQMIKKAQCLEQLDAKDIVFTQKHMNILKRPLQVASQLRILKLENCGLISRAFVILVSALKQNTGLKELYLADNGLIKQDAQQLAALLRLNNTLQLLDISNNMIGDQGAIEVIDGLIAQSKNSQGKGGLSILIMWNNQLTKNISGKFAALLSHSNSLETLNIGQNAMSDDFLDVCKDSLKANRVLLQLGIQSTGLMIKGILALAEIIEKNETLQRIDLRNNNIQLTGLTFLLLALKKNTVVTQIDLDDKACSKTAAIVEQYTELITEIRGYCTRNEELAESSESSTESSSTTTDQQRSRLSSVSSRKISLTCQTLSPRCLPPVSVPESAGPRSTASRGRLRSPAPSPIPSPVASPIPSPSRRFLVSRVCESSLTTTNNTPCNFPAVPSRFRVTRVEPAAPVYDQIELKITPDEPTTLAVQDNSEKPEETQEISADNIFKCKIIPETVENLDQVTGNICENGKSSLQDVSLDVTMENMSLNEEKNSEQEVLRCEDVSEPFRPSLDLDEVFTTMENSEDTSTETELIYLRPQKLEDESSRPATSLERLLSLFQHPGNFFSAGFVDKVEGKSPLREGMNSMMALGDKFQQYLRDGRSDERESRVNMCNKTLNVPVSESCDRLANDSINIFNDDLGTNNCLESVNDNFTSLEEDKTILLECLQPEKSVDFFAVDQDEDQAFNEDIHDILTSMLDRIPVGLSGPEVFFNEKSSPSMNASDDNHFLTADPPINDDKGFMAISNQPRGSFQESVDSGIGSECSSVSARGDAVYIPREEDFFVKDDIPDGDFGCSRLQPSKLPDTQSVES